MGRHSRPDPPPSRRPAEAPRRDYSTSWRPRHHAPGDSRPQLPPARGPLPRVSARQPAHHSALEDTFDDLDAPTRKTSPGDGIADLEAPTTKTTSRPTRRGEPDVPSPHPRSLEPAGQPAIPDAPGPADEFAEYEEFDEPDEFAAFDESGELEELDERAPVAALTTSSSSRRSEPSGSRPMSETGYHRAIGSSRRGIAKWPIAVAAVIALFALGGLGVVWANKALNAKAEAEADSCTEGTTTLLITTTPTVEDDVTSAAKSWNAEDRSVYSHCITVEVASAAPEEVLETLRGKDASEVPAAWIVPSATWPERLAETNPERVSSTAKPLKDADGIYYPYVVVGGDGVDEVQQRAAQEFRDHLRTTFAR